MLGDQDLEGAIFFLKEGERGGGLVQFLVLMVCHSYRLGVCMHTWEDRGDIEEMDGGFVCHGLN